MVSRIAFVLGCVAVFSCKAPTEKTGPAASKESPDPKSEDHATAAPAAPAALPVDVATLLKDYKDNEVRADQKYKGKRLRITGVVDEIKKDLTDSIYVTVGTGAQFELPIAQCSFGDEHLKEAAALSHGNKVAVECTGGGLMINVMLNDCAFAESVALTVCHKLEAAGAATACEGKGPTTAGFGAQGSHTAGIVGQYDDAHVFDAMVKLSAGKMPNSYSSKKAHVIVSWKSDVPAYDAKIRAVVDGL